MDKFVYTNAIFHLLLKESFRDLHMPPCVKKFFMGYKWLGQAVKWNSLFHRNNSAGSVLIVYAVNVQWPTLQTTWNENTSYAVRIPIPIYCVYFPVTGWLYDKEKVINIPLFPLLSQKTSVFFWVCLPLLKFLLWLINLSLY